MTAGQPLVLIVEDDDAIAEGLALNLKIQGYRTENVREGGSAVERIVDAVPDLVLLDITLPKKSGLAVLSELRDAGNHTPVIVLSARQDETDKVAALRLGADDYVTKPFALAELLARVVAVLRRSQPRVAPPEPPAKADSTRRLAFGDIVIDLDTRTVMGSKGAVKLTHLEFELLAFLAQNLAKVYSREELLREVWQTRAGTTRTVDNFVAQLRAKIEDNPEQPRYLVTVRGTGYRFDP